MQVLQTMSAMATSLAALESAERARAAEEVCSCVIDYNCTGDAYCCQLYRRLLFGAALHPRLTISGYCTVKVSCR